MIVQGAKEKVENSKILVMTIRNYINLKFKVSILFVKNYIFQVDPTNHISTFSITRSELWNGILSIFSSIFLFNYRIFWEQFSNTLLFKPQPGMYPGIFSDEVPKIIFERKKNQNLCICINKKKKLE